MSLSDVLLQNLMPKNFLDSSDDETESWTSSSGSSNQSCESSGGCLRASKGQPNYHVFEDYFGLSNLLQNVQISEDNPFFYPSQCGKNDLLFRGRNRRLSWESDASDPMAVISPTLDAPSYSYSGLIGDYSVIQSTPSDTTSSTHQSAAFDGGFKQLPPPSMRLSKAVRDQIINGSFQSNNQPQQTLPQPQQHFINRREDLNPLHTPTAMNTPSQSLRSQTSHLSAGQVSSINSNTTTNNSLVVGQSLLPARSVPQPQQVCVFCRNNGESEAVYSSHVLKDCEGRTACPILRAYTCPICKANGDNSHTIKYCPLNQHNNVGNHHAAAMAARQVASNPGSMMAPPPPNAGMMPPNLHQQQQNNTNNLLRNNNTMSVAPVSCHSRVVRPPFSTSVTNNTNNNSNNSNNNNMMQRMKQR